MKLQYMPYVGVPTFSVCRIYFTSADVNGLCYTKFKVANSTKIISYLILALLYYLLGAI